jgi:hypothetical protein
VNIIRSDDNLSYDEKMLSEKGSKYLYSKKIMEITTDSSVVCFWAGDGDLDASIAAYFLYPRFTKEIAGSGKIALAQIAELGCTHVFFNKGKPDFNLKARRIFLFSEKFEDSPVIVNSQLYLYENHEYLDKTGIIEL